MHHHDAARVGQVTKLIPLMAAVLLLTAGCGTRVSRSDGIAASASVGTPVAAEAQVRGAGTATGEGGPSDSATAAQAATGRPSAAQGDGAAGTPSVSADKASPVGAAKPGSSVTSGANRTGPPAAGQSGTDPSGVGTPAPPGAPTKPVAPDAGGAKSLVKIGSVGTHSGPVGGVLRGTLEALQVWQRHVNDRGGLNGHPVRIILVDDGGDSARHLAAMKDLVERHKVIAFVQENAPIGNGRSSISYIESKRVPVIGSETGSQWFYESPMYFPQAPSGLLAFYAGVVSHGRAVTLGKKKLATIACAEVNACQDADNIYAKYAPAQGFNHVYRARASVTQPDFTAECLAARNAGADFLVFAADTASIGRATGSCARQGYRPTVGLLMSMITDGQKDDPNLVGALGTSNVFPWFQNNTPATAEFQAAMRKYLPSAQLGIAHATAWTSAKLLEKATSALSDSPTPDEILRVLWSMKDESLGGITKVSFSEGKPAAKIVCWYDIAIKDKRWVSVDEFALHCVDPPAGL